MRKLILTAACLLVLPLILTLPLRAEDDLLQKSKALFKPVPDSPPELEDNPITPDKIELGKMLFFEPRLSASNLISCNTCHNLGTGGVDLQETSVGHAWQRGPRNAPTVLNSVFNIAQFWDGRAKNLAEQAKGPVQASVEMSNSPERVTETLSSMPEYVALFTKSFPGDKNPFLLKTLLRQSKLLRQLYSHPTHALTSSSPETRKRLMLKRKKGSVFL